MHRAQVAAVEAAQHYPGLVGPSGVIGTGIGSLFTGLCGPSGCVGPSGK